MQLLIRSYAWPQRLRNQIYLDGKKDLRNGRFVFCGTLNAKQRGPVMTKQIESLLFLGPSRCLYILCVQSACRPALDNVRASILVSVPHPDLPVHSGAFVYWTSIHGRLC
jgi:hypothetical protein